MCASRRCASAAAAAAAASGRHRNTCCPSHGVPRVRRQSKHPHNIEPLLLTLARPANSDTRKRFAELAGELVLVERVLSDEVICEDLQVVMGNRVESTPDGMLYPNQRSQVGGGPRMGCTHTPVLAPACV